MSTTSVFMFYVIYQAWDAGFHHQMKHWEERWKYDVQRLDELRGVPSGDETLCQMLDITSQTKWFYQKKLRMQKWAVLHLNSKHSLNMNFLSIFFMNYWWVWEVQMKNFNKKQFLVWCRAERLESYSCGLWCWRILEQVEKYAYDFY